MHLQHPFLDAALVGVAGLGAYELWHHHHYGTWGFGNPNNHVGATGTYGAPYAYGAATGYPTSTGHHHHHHHLL
jgi:hypothetical protein